MNVYKSTLEEYKDKSNILNNLISEYYGYKAQIKEKSDSLDKTNCYDKDLDFYIENSKNELNAINFNKYKDDITILVSAVKILLSKVNTNDINKCISEEEVKYISDIYNEYCLNNNNNLDINKDIEKSYTDKSNEDDDGELIIEYIEKTVNYLHDKKIIKEIEINQIDNKNGYKFDDLKVNLKLNDDGILYVYEVDKEKIDNNNNKKTNNMKFEDWIVKKFKIKSDDTHEKNENNNRKSSSSTYNPTNNAKFNNKKTVASNSYSCNYNKNDGKKLTIKK